MLQALEKKADRLTSHVHSRALQWTLRSLEEEDHEFEDFLMAFQDYSRQWAISLGESNQNWSIGALDDSARSRQAVRDLLDWSPPRKNPKTTSYGVPQRYLVLPQHHWTSFTCDLGAVDLADERFMGTTLRRDVGSGDQVGR